MKCADRCSSSRTPVAALLVAAGLLAARPSAAQCKIAEPVNYFTFGLPVPAADSTDVARDVALILRGQGYGLGGSPIIASWFTSTVASVRMTDPAGQEVPGSFGDSSDTSLAVSWRPANLLAASTRYHVVATLASQSTPRPTEAQGSETLDFSFTTGTAMTPPLALEGGMAASVIEGTLPVSDCTQNGFCPATCSTIGERPALFAIATVPGIHGGADAGGYKGLLVLTDTTGVSFTGPGGTTSTPNRIFESQSFDSAPGQAQTLQIELPASDTPYVPCLSLNAWDLTGSNVVAPTLCLDPVAPKKSAAKTSSGCAFSRPANHTGQGWAQLLLCLAALTLARRRRPPDPPIPDRG